MKFIPKRGIRADFKEDLLIPGEFAEILDKHTLVFCFEKGKVTYLNVDESVPEEKADELIEKIDWFIKNSFNVYQERWGFIRNGKQG